MPVTFDFKRFCDQNRIEYITKGVNVKRNEINISCPFCADDGNPDPSYHLGVNPKSLSFSCWRNQQRHRGRRLHRLLMRLARINYDEACRLLGTVVIISDLEDWRAMSAKLRKHESLFGGDDGLDLPSELDMPSEFRDFKGSKAELPFSRYLNSRGFPQRHVHKLAECYDLKYVKSGQWSNRIIVPLYLNYELVGWTSRSIDKRSELRYLTLSEDDGALVNIKTMLYQYDDLLDSGGDVLFIVEGPFDVLKLDYFARQFNCRATCIFGKAAKPPQMYLLNSLCKIFHKVVILLDPNEVGNRLEMVRELSVFGDRIMQKDVSKWADDPGDLQSRHIKYLINEVKQTKVRASIQKTKRIKSMPKMYVQKLGEV